MFVIICVVILNAHNHEGLPLGIHRYKSEGGVIQNANTSHCKLSLHSGNGMQ